jgi:uncharacterized protein (DUF1501 family)
MTNERPPGIDRRSFLAAAGLVPLGLGASGLGCFAPSAPPRTLVVLELVGGNDGLNTVIPVDDRRYAALRPRLSAVRRGAHALADGTALHPALRRLAGLGRDGGLAVVHGVGYAEPDRSHFRSRDIWHVADPSHQQVAASTTGWLGRAAAALALSDGVPAAAVGSLEVPLLLRTPDVTVPSLRRVEDFQWLAAAHAGPVPTESPSRRLADEAAAAGALDAGPLGHAARTMRLGLGMAERLTRELDRYRPAADYPSSALGRDLQLVARLAVSGIGARLVHVGFGGFDTHARQLPAHEALLAQLDAALAAFVTDVRAHGRSGDVAVLVHSEFGRRAAENASQGTDHGAGGPVFVLGPVTAAQAGPVPDLEQLVDGDVPGSIDFRRVYAELLRWLGADERAVLGGEFGPLGVLASTPR